MSTKVVHCPWCQSTNMTNKLAERRWRCRSCGRDVQWGLNYVKTKQAERRKLKTKKERKAARRQLESTPEYQTMQRGRKLVLTLHRAERRLTLGWSRLRTAVDEHDLAAVARAVRTCQLAERVISRTTREMQAHQQTVAAVMQDARAVILPD